MRGAKIFSKIFPMLNAYFASIKNAALFNRIKIGK